MARAPKEWPHCTSKACTPPALGMALNGLRWRTAERTAAPHAAEASEELSHVIHRLGLALLTWGPQDTISGLPSFDGSSGRGGRCLAPFAPLFSSSSLGRQVMGKHGAGGGRGGGLEEAEREREREVSERRAWRWRQRPGTTGVGGSQWTARRRPVTGVHSPATSASSQTTTA